jgi:hypothetical protein
MLVSSGIALDNGAIDKPYYNGQPFKRGKVSDLPRQSGVNEIWNALPYDVAQ